jgi:histidyl-tRNA synthetase
MPEQEPCQLFLATKGDQAVAFAMQLVNALRAEGMYVQMDVTGRSLKAQMKFADKLDARYTLVLGDEELQTGRANLKNMHDGTEEPMRLDNFALQFENKILQALQEDLQAYFNE